MSRKVAGDPQVPRERKARVRGGATLKCGCRVEVGKGGRTILVLDLDCIEHDWINEVLEEEEEQD